MQSYDRVSRSPHPPPNFSEEGRWHDIFGYDCVVWDASG
jgi:hypothetical protein